MNLGRIWDRATQIRHSQASSRTEWRPFQDIVDFFDRCTGIRLTSQQRFIYKCIYGLPLDNSRRDIVLYDQFVEQVAHEFTEVEFFKYLKDEGRINQESPEAMVGRNFILVILPIGRRGSKSFLTAGVQAYEASRLLSKYSPHQYYNIIPGEKIWMKSVAPTGGQSSIIFDFARSIMLSNKFFDDFWNKDISGYIALNSRYELDQVALGRRGFANPKGSICMTFEACISRHLRGPGHYMITLDEISHFILATGSISSDEQVYQALAPSTATFKDPRGRKDGRVFMISSPLNQAGLMYTEYANSFESPEDTLMIQLPTWEANPTRIDTATLRKEFKRSPEIFDVEYGAKFSTVLNVYCPMEWCEWSFDRNLKRQEKGQKTTWYYLGTDLGYRSDATAFVIVHLDWEGNVILDYVEHWDPEEIGIENNAAAVEDHLVKLYKLFNIHGGILDQFNGWAVRDNLHRRGIKNIQLVNVTEGFKTKCYIALKDYLRNKKIHGYWDDKLCLELVRLREVKKSEYVLDVSKFGAFKDDLADAFARATFLALEAAQQGQRGREIREDQLMQARGIRRRPRLFTPGVNRFGVRR